MSLIHYLLEANLYLVAFYLLYVLLLRSETHYQLNREYLLVTSFMAFIIPMLQLGILKPEIKQLANAGMVSANLEQVSVSVIPASIVVEAPKWTTVDYTLAIYGIVSLIMFVLLIYKIVKLISLSKKGNAIQQDGFVLVEIPGENVAFSFFSYLFVNKELSTSQTIIHHEEVHIRQKHSWDVIYLELLKIFNWFNPAVYLLQRSLKEVHEFIADQHVATTENGAADYADFLISNAYGLTQNQLTNSFFNKNLLKRRIIMLYQKKSGRAARLKYLLTLPLMGSLLCLSTLAFTTKNYGLVDLVPKHITPAHSTAESKLTGTNGQSAEYKKLPDTKNQADYSKKNISGKKTEKETATPPSDPDSVYKAAEINPSFPGGEAAFSKFLRDNIRYPKEAKENNVQGRTFSQFIVEKDGSLSNLKLVRDPGTGLGAEALRVLALSPKWLPGKSNGEYVRVQYTIPINFSLAGNDSPPSAVALYLHLRNYVRYPTYAKDRNIQGRVFVSFIVNADKKVQDITVLRAPDKTLSDEVSRVLANYNFADWKANVYYTIMVNFNINYGDNVKDAPKPTDAHPIFSNQQPGSMERINLHEVSVTTYPAVSK